MSVFTPRPLGSRPSTPASHFANISRLSLDSRLSCVNHAFSSSPDSRLLDNDDSEIVPLPPSPDCVLSNASRHHGFSSKCLVCLHQRASSFDRYNFLGARLPVPSSLNIPFRRSRLEDYSDYAICDFLEFGWPVGLDYACSLSSARVANNHKGALDFPSAVDSYLSMELDRGAVIGPFAGNPFSHAIVVSPLNSVPKANSAERWMILDHSWPSGSSINDTIPDRIYLSQPYSLVYPTINTLRIV